MPRSTPEFQPGAVLHEVLVGAFRAQGTSFEAWCRDHGVSPTNARQASFGQSRGKVGQAILTRMIEAAGPEFIRDVYMRRLEEHYRQWKRGTAA